MCANHLKSNPLSQASRIERGFRIPPYALLCTLVLSGWGAAFCEPKKEPLLAVMDILNNTGEFTAFVEGLPDMLITELMEFGDVKLVERTKVQTAMKAMKLETSGLTQERNIELGKWLGVDGILFGTFNRVGDKYRLDVRAIDVQTGKIDVAASATCEKKNIMDLIHEIGSQLRTKLVNFSSGKTGARSVASVSSNQKPRRDSCLIDIQFKMIVGLLAQVGVAHQRVRVYLDNQLLHVSDAIDELNRYLSLYQGSVPEGDHTLVLVHGTVDKRGRWIRELESQPDGYSFNIRNGDRYFIQYRMEAHDRWNTFSDFNVKYHHPQKGE